MRIKNKNKINGLLIVVEALKSAGLITNEDIENANKKLKEKIKRKNKKKK